MLPRITNIENTDDLVSEIVNETQNNTETFNIFDIFNVDEDNKDAIPMNTRTSAILGVGVLGEMILGESGTNINTGIDIVYSMGGKIDGLDALKQNIFLMLSIEADQYIIYPYTYGIQTLDLIGKPSYYVMALIPERIKGTLLTDDRITDVSDFEFDVSTNKLNVKFVVHTIYGDIKEETAVMY